MTVAAAWYSPASGSFWTDILALAAIVATFFIAWKTNPKKRLICTIVSRSRLLDAPASMRDELEMRYQNRTLTDPYVIACEIASAGRAAIPKRSFDDEQSLKLSLNAPILRLLAVEREPKSAFEPTILANHDIIELRPVLIAKREIIRLSVLTKGAVGSLGLNRDPFTDVKLETSDREAEEVRRRKRWSAVRLATPIAALIALILVVVATTLSISNANAQVSTVTQGLVCISTLEFGQSTQLSMTLAYRDITVRRSNDGQLRRVAFAPSYKSDVIVADQQLRYLEAVYPGLENSGIPLGNAASVSAYARQASAIMARLPKEGTGAAASKDLYSAVHSGAPAIQSGYGCSQAMPLTSSARTAFPF
jgi:hypothetical protein